MRGYKETPERIYGVNPCDSTPTKEQFADYEGMSVQVCRGKKPWPIDVRFVKSEDVLEFARSVGMIDDARERFYAIYVNQKNEPQGYRLISAGTATETIVDPKILFQPAMALGTPGMFCLHNHPSGYVEPSAMDKALMKRLQKVSEIVNVRIVDFMVVGAHGIYSFVDNGLL